MFLPDSYGRSPFWLTIDVERIEDANFGVKPKRSSISIDYEKIIDRWIELCQRHETTSCAFVLGSFAKKYPHLIRRLADHGHEIASHGLSHDLVYTLPFQKWKEQTRRSKELLEDLIAKPVMGYRSPSWSLPFQKRYYEALAEIGFAFSSSYFPFKTYMYGNEVDKKRPFCIHTPSGTITEIPVPKVVIPFSGGFYLRMLPASIACILASFLTKRGVRPIIYTHPYELQDRLFFAHLDEAKMDLAYVMSFANTGGTKKRIEKMIRCIKERRWENSLR